MSEQEIDAELVRYEPGVCHIRGCYYWSASGGLPAAKLGRWLGLALFRHLKAGKRLSSWRDYPTRAAALADLRQAIRASCLVPGTGAGLGSTRARHD